MVNLAVFVYFDFRTCAIRTVKCKVEFDWFNKLVNLKGEGRCFGSSRPNKSRRGTPRLYPDSTPRRNISQET